MLRNKGFSLIEVMLTIAIVGISASAAVPMFGDYLENTRLRGVAERAYGEVQLAKSEAIRSNENVYLTVNSNTAWCYGFASTANCSCSTNACTVNTAKAKGISLTTDAAITSGIHVSPSGAVYNSSNTVTNGLLTFSIGNSKSVSVQISRLGQLNICSSTLPGYSSCL